MPTTNPPTFSPSHMSQTDVQLLVDRVAELERTQQQEDVNGFLALFESSAIWVNGAGRRLIGLDAIAEFTRSVLPGAMAHGSVSYEVDHIAFLSSDIAATGVNQQYVDNEGNPTGAGSPTYIWLNKNGVWKIVAGQNTAVVVD